MLYGLVTIPQIIEDAKRAWAANVQISAMLTCFALVDECSKIEWLKTHEKLEMKEHEKAFAAWYNMWFKADGSDESIMKEMKKFERKHKENRKSDNGTSPDIDGQLLYKLRCFFVHALSTHIDFENSGLADDANRHIKDFSILISEPNEYACCIACTSHNKEKENSMCIDIQGLINSLLYLVDLYYKRNKDTQKFNTMCICDFTGDYIKPSD